ncbi:unnamed protein product [Rhizophagus irregularis]|uniref:Uncharacterized protein n=1 Tax=Rhizophagus irregularis TaxID=588596 RepID=A0A915ZG72_9GLOM|nr:unnamed protein product [Rhizophagus irregularis]
MPYNIKTQLQRIIDNEYLTARKFLTGSIFKIHIFDQFVFLTMGNILFYVLLNNNSKLFQNYVKCITNDKNKYFSSEIRSTMYLIPTLNTQEEVLTVFNKIQLCDEPGWSSSLGKRQTCSMGIYRGRDFDKRQ